MWISRRELARLIRDLEEAKAERAIAEGRLHEVSLAALDTKATREGGRPVSARIPQEPEIVQPENREQVIERLKQADPHRWQIFLGWAREAGRPDSDAEQWLYNEAMGLPQPFEQVQ
jgi:hypothetical protein